jgi:hypothetical protein
VGLRSGEVVVVAVCGLEGGAGGGGVTVALCCRLPKLRTREITEVRYSKDVFFTYIYIYMHTLLMRC